MEHRSDSSHSGLDNAYIGCRVREARAEYGMTQEELAGDVGVDPKHISWIENGRKHGSDQLIRRISEVTGKPLSFFYGNEPMPDDASDKEKEILMKYRKATAQQQKLIESLIDAVINNA